MQICASSTGQGLPVLQKALASLACVQSARLRPAIHHALASAAEDPVACAACADLEAATTSALLPWLQTALNASQVIATTRIPTSSQHELSRLCKQHLDVAACVAAQVPEHVLLAQPVKRVAQQVLEALCGHASQARLVALGVSANMLATRGGFCVAFAESLTRCDASCGRYSNRFCKCAARHITYSAAASAQ